jgi:hypothetical protein
MKTIKTVHYELIDNKDGDYLFRTNNLRIARKQLKWEGPPGTVRIVKITTVEKEISPRPPKRRR